MSGHGKKATVIAVLTAAFVLAACVGSGDDAAPGTNTPIEADAPATEVSTTEAADELERAQAVDEFLAAVESNQNCTSPECLTAQAMHDRYQDLYELATAIPGDDILPFIAEMSSAWDTWNDCLSAAESRFERSECAEESGMEQAITDLYDALR